ncbi:MAG TPA: DUF3592 domain-containing protein [Pseudomonadales bacterium]|nr:DUF3592 domain-containing protein [Pseudomonadales bacterium]
MDPDSRIVLEVFLAVSAALFALGFWFLHQERAARKWPQVSGTIITSTIDAGQKEAQPVIEYEFTYQGRSYKSSHWRFGNYSTGYRFSAKDAISYYPAGQPVTVFVNVRNPAKSVLEATPSSLCWVPFGSGLFLFVISIVIILTSTQRSHHG